MDFGKIAFRVVHHRFRRINRPRRSAGSTLVGDRFRSRSFAKLVDAAIAFAGRLRRGRRNCLGLQRTDRRRDFRGRDRSRLDGDGNARSADFFERHRDSDRARISRTRSALQNSAVSAEPKLGDCAVSLARSDCRPDRALVHSIAERGRGLGRAHHGCRFISRCSSAD